MQSILNESMFADTLGAVGGHLGPVWTTIYERLAILIPWTPFLPSVGDRIDPVNTFLLSEVVHVGPVCLQISPDMLRDIHWRPNLYHGTARSC